MNSIQIADLNIFSLGSYDYNDIAHNKGIQDMHGSIILSRFCDVPGCSSWMWTGIWDDVTQRISDFISDSCSHPITAPRYITESRKDYIDNWTEFLIGFKYSICKNSVISVGLIVDNYGHIFEGYSDTKSDERIGRYIESD